MAAAPPTSEVAICNLALARLGQKKISSIESPTTPNEDLCALHFASTRRALLRAYIFNFAKKYAQLTPNTAVTPAFGFTLAYNKPNDFLRLLALGDITINNDLPPGLYDLSEDYLFTDSASEDDDVLNIAYIKDVPQVPKWDALFVNLMRLQLAQDMAYGFTLKPSLIKSLEDELMKAETKATAVAGQEKPPRRIERSRFRSVRRLGSSNRNTSRYPV